MVSICMPVFNSAPYLAEAIWSIQNQSDKDWELIAVNDCSTDSSATLLNWYAEKDKRIKVFHNQKNMGIAYTRNLALQQATGAFIAVMDSDDVMHPDRLKKSLKAIVGYDFVYSPYMQADENAKVFGVYNPPAKAKDHILDGDWPHVTIMAKRACFVAHPYRPELRVNDDSAILLDWYKAGYKAKKINEPLMIVRYHPDSVSVRKDKAAKKVLAKLQAELALFNG